MEKAGITQRTDLPVGQRTRSSQTRDCESEWPTPDYPFKACHSFVWLDPGPRAYEADGKTVRAGKDAITPMTLDEWVDQQVADTPHLFESNAGGGAAGNGSREAQISI